MTWCLDIPFKSISKPLDGHIVTARQHSAAKKSGIESRCGDHGVCMFSPLKFGAHQQDHLRRMGVGGVGVEREGAEVPFLS